MGQRQGPPMAERLGREAARPGNTPTGWRPLWLAAPARRPRCAPPQLPRPQAQQASSAARHGLRHRALVRRQVLAHDEVFVMGDLNYRIDGLPDDEILANVQRGEYNRLACAAYDQLLRQMQAGRIFWGFREGPLSFAPTYKFSPDSDQYLSGAKGRAPAWCDRCVGKPRTADVFPLCGASTCA